MKEIKINIKGMVCGGCQKRVENALGNIEGLEKVTANYKDGTVLIISNKEIDKTIFNEKIEDIGFEIVEEDWYEENYFIDRRNDL